MHWQSQISSWYHFVGLYYYEIYIYFIVVALINLYNAVEFSHSCIKHLHQTTWYGDMIMFPGGATAVKLVDRETLLKEREQKKQLEKEKQAEKERKRLEKLALDEAKEAQRKIPPWEMFRGETDTYSQFDEKVFILSVLIGVSFWTKA